MLRRAFPLLLAALVIAPTLAQDRIVSPTMQRNAAAAQATYYPERLNWEHKKPEDVGMNPALVNEAVKIAMDSETQGPKDMALFLHSSFGKEPFSTIVGPIVNAVCGLIAKFDPEFQQRLRQNIILGGGGSQLKGLDRVIEASLREYGGAKVTRVNDATYAGAVGALKLAMSMPTHGWTALKAFAAPKKTTTAAA